MTENKIFDLSNLHPEDVYNFHKQMILDMYKNAFIPEPIQRINKIIDKLLYNE